MAVIPYIPNTQMTNVKSGTHADILRIQNVDTSKIYGLWSPASNPLLYRLTNTFSRGPAVHDPVFTWFESDKPPTYTTVYSECSESAGTSKPLVITDANVVANTTLYDESTGEWLRVTAVGTITDAGGYNDGQVAVTVTRGDAGTTATVATLPVGRMLRIGPTLLAEGADANSGTTWQPVSTFQYCTYFSESVQETDVQQNSITMFGVHTLDDQEAITTLRMMEQMETQMRYGVIRLDALGTTTGRNVYRSGGFENLTDITAIALQGSELDWKQLNTQFNPIWEANTGGSIMKEFIAGSELFDQIVHTHYDRVSEVVFSPSLGTTVTKLNMTSGGILSMVRDPWGFKGNQKKGYVIDMDKVEFREHAGMEMQKRDISDNDSHEIKREIFGSMCPVFRNASHHAVVTWTEN